MTDEKIPWHSDVVQRPVAFVRARGGVFVCGGQKGTFQNAQWIIHRNEMITDTTIAHWSIVKIISESGKHLVDSIQPFCGAYGAVGENPATEQKGTPTFIMAGRYHSYLGELVFEEFEIIMTSKDGRAWTETRRQPSGYCYAAGWSKKDKKFYVQCAEFGDPGSSAFNIVVLSSGDGSSWSQADSVPQTGFGNYAHKLLMDTGNELVKDSAGQKVPNGSYYGINEGETVIIKPKILVPYFPSRPGGGANNEIEIIKKITDPETGAVTIVKTAKTLPIDRITCVAYAGKVWQAGGYMGSGPDVKDGVVKIATSTNDGDTWHVDYSVTEQMAFCLMGAPPGMFT